MTEVNAASLLQSANDDVVDIADENNNLDKDAFFKLLITQLKNQDPLQPMEDKEFIAQMAQFSSLEQMQNMNQNLSKFMELREVSQGAALIGKKIEGTVEAGEKEEVVEGVVEKVSFEGDKAFALLEDGETKVAVENINAVY